MEPGPPEIDEFDIVEKSLDATKLDAELHKNSFERISVADLLSTIAAAEACRREGHGAFRRLSVVIGVSTPTLSERISRVEDFLGVIIFERAENGRRGLNLTASGLRFIEAGAEIRLSLQKITDLRKYKGKITQKEAGQIQDLQDYMYRKRTGRSDRLRTKK